MVYLLVCHEGEKEHIIYLRLQKSKLQSYLQHQPFVSYIYLSISSSHMQNR